MADNALVVFNLASPNKQEIPSPLLPAALYSFCRAPYCVEGWAPTNPGSTSEHALPCNYGSARSSRERR
jgi:hypothetical protein